LTETELLKPLRNLLHRGSEPDYRASSARIGKFIRGPPMRQRPWPRRNAPAASAGAPQAGKGQPAGSSP
jgi:hypothetical protein